MNNTLFGPTKFQTWIMAFCDGKYQTGFQPAVVTDIECGYQLPKTFQFHLQ